MTSNSYDGYLAELYDHSQFLSRKPTDAAIQFYVDETLKSGSPVLELGAATGLYTLPLARAGLAVTAVDLSPEMLGALEKKVSAEDAAVRARVTLKEGDMRDVTLNQRFRTVLMPGNVFLYNLTQDDQLKTLKNVQAHLDADGLLIFDVFAPDRQMIAAALPSCQYHEFAVPSLGSRILCQQTVEIEPFFQLERIRLIHERIGQDGSLSDRNLTVLTMRYIFPSELLLLLRLANFRLRAFYGDFQSRRGKSRYDGNQVVLARPARSQAEAIRQPDLVTAGGRAGAAGEHNAGVLR